MQRVQRTPSLRDQALLQLRKAIVVGDLEPGSVHSEQTIAAKLGLSRTPIREALLQLVGEGLVVFIPNKGARVAELDPEHLAHVLQFRAAIEGCGASRFKITGIAGRVVALLGSVTGFVVNLRKAFPHNRTKTFRVQASSLI